MKKKAIKQFTQVVQSLDKSSKKKVKGGIITTETAAL